MDPWLIYDGLVALYVLVIAAIVWRQRRLGAEVAASRPWVPVASRVVESRLDQIHAVKGGTTYVPVVIYEYAVGGQAYRSSRLHFGDPVGYSFERRAERRRAALAAAAAVQVFHHPTDPLQVVVERSAPVQKRNTVLLAILLVVLAGILIGPAFI